MQQKLILAKINSLKVREHPESTHARRNGGLVHGLLKYGGAGVDNFLKSPKNLAKCGKIIHHINASRRGELEDGA